MTPVRLAKVEEKGMMDKIEEFALNHANIILPLCIVLLVVLFILLCYALVGVSAVESGNTYNHFQDVI